ncbi:MAG TPA: ribosomal RNA small subunit methyltransferase I [Caulobacteraceae bacterium]|jgi:16S rRNA (cytidine1402-2'-O)-methyltransferase
MADVEIAFRGHAQVKASNPERIELIAGEAWSQRPAAIGYDVEYDPAALLKLRGRVRAEVSAGAAGDVFEATISTRFMRGAPLVLGRDAAPKRELAYQASKAAADLQRDLVDALRQPDAHGLMRLTPQADAPPPLGSLTLVSMPIGNQADLSPRALDVLMSVDVILAEDTRAARDALAWRGVRTRMESCYAQNEERRAASLADRLRASERIAYVSDAGTPTVSDPGAILVRTAAALGAHVTAVPGASAVVMALAVSGLAQGGGFTFQGFPGRAAGARRDFVARALASPQPTVMFEAPGRALGLLELIADAAPGREIAICRDLTKRSEAVLRGKVDTVLEQMSGLEEVRGEYTIVLAGADAPAGAPAAVRPMADIEAFMRALLAAGCPVAPIVSALRAGGAPRREAYALVSRMAAERAAP